MLLFTTPVGAFSAGIGYITGAYKMETKKTVKSVLTGFERRLPVEYRDLVFIFYEYLSSRSLAMLASCLYDKNEVAVYVKIDNNNCKRKR